MWFKRNFNHVIMDLPETPQLSHCSLPWSPTLLWPHASPSRAQMEDHPETSVETLVFRIGAPNSSKVNTAAWWRRAAAKKRGRDRGVKQGWRKRSLREARSEVRFFLTAKAQIKEVTQSIWANSNNNKSYGRRPGSPATPKVNSISKASPWKKKTPRIRN